MTASKSVNSSPARDLFDSILQDYGEPAPLATDESPDGTPTNNMAQATITPNLQRLALVNVCLGQFLSALDSRSVNVALPTISLYFETSLAAVQWIPLAYQLTIVGLVLSMARLGDKLGRKGLYTLGFIMLGVGSAACGLSPYLWMIVCFRAVEGIGGALVLANGRAIASASCASRRGSSPRTGPLDRGRARPSPCRATALARRRTRGRDDGRSRTRCRGFPRESDPRRAADPARPR